MKTPEQFVVSVALIFSANFSIAAKKLFYGLTHAHTYFSNGSGTPEDSYRVAKENGVDFFAATKHNHDEAESSADARKDGILISLNHALYTNSTLVQITRQGQNLTVKSVKKPAAHMSARFTYFSLAGRFTSGQHIVDGGYFENSSFSTAKEALNYSRYVEGVFSFHWWQRMFPFHSVGNLSQGAIDEMNRQLGSTANSNAFHSVLKRLPR